jgi:hypothetical protein
MFSVVPHDRQRRTRPFSLIRGYEVAEKVMVLSTDFHLNDYFIHYHGKTWTVKGNSGLSFQPLF